jgi:hypothetical protein
LRVALRNRIRQDAFQLAQVFPFRAHFGKMRSGYFARLRAASRPLTSCFESRAANERAE